MAKKKISAMTATTTLADADLLPTVVNPGTTPASRKISTANARNSLIGSTVFVRPSGGDDTAAIAAAFAAVSPFTRMIFRGAYNVSDSCTLAVNDIMLDGEGATITQTGTDKNTFTVTSDRVKVRGFHFIGKGTETPWGDGNGNNVSGLFLSGVDDCEVSACRFTNHAGGSLSIIGVCNRVKIVDNTMVGKGSGSISYNGNGSDAGINSHGNIQAKNGLVISRNDVSGHAQGIFATTGTCMLVSDNLVHDIPGQHGIYIQEGGDLTISGNTVSDVAENGIKVQPQNAVNAMGNVNVVGNTCTRCETGIIVIPAGAAVGYHAHNVTVIGNNIYNSTSYGMYVRGAFNAFVHGNRIAKSGHHGMYLQDLEGVVSDNYISDSETAAVYLFAPENRVVIDGLTIVDCPLNVANSDTLTYQCAIYLTDDASPNNGYVYMSDVSMRYERATPPAKLTYSIYGHSNTKVVLTGPVKSELTVDLHLVGYAWDYREINNVNESAPAHGKDKAFLYAYDVAAGKTCIHAKTEEGHVVKLFRGSAVADATGAGDVVAQLNALLARLRVTGGNGLIAD